MANYDVVGNVILPIFITGWDIGNGFIFSDKPYTTLTVPVYEYSGDVADIDSSRFPTLSQISDKLASVYIATNSYPTLAILASFTNWTYERTGVVVDYTPPTDSDSAFHLIPTSITQGTIGGVNGRIDYGVIIKDPDSVNRKFILLSPGGSPVSFTAGVLSNYAGEVEVPEIEPEPDSISVEPHRVYVEQGDVVQFTAYADGIEYPNVEWSLYEADSTQEETELNGVTIDQTGKMTVNELTMSGWWVKAKFTQWSKSISAKVLNKNNPYGPDGNSGPGGGGGTFNPGQSDDVAAGVPQGSNIGQDSATGMYTRYLMNTSYLELLGAWMWDPNLGLSLIKTALESWYGEKSSEALISLLSFPFSLSIPLTGVNTVDQKLFFGHTPVGQDQFKALTSGSCQMDWGTISLEEYWGNFLDYAPHTKIELYLPWGTGFVELDPGQCLPGTISVKTNIEFARGSCVHNIINQSGTVIGTYMGQPGAMVPLISSDIAARRAGIVVSAASLAVGGALAGTAGALSSARSSITAGTYTRVMSGMNSYASMGERTAMATRVANAAGSAIPSVEGELVHASGFPTRIASMSAQASARHPASVYRNSGFGDASAGMMVQYPYVIISRPEQSVAAGYGHHYGYPSNIYEQLRYLKGYTEIAAIHLNGIGCTDAEQAELEEILSGGVIF